MFNRLNNIFSKRMAGFVAIFLILPLILSACLPNSSPMRETAARRLAMPVFMLPRDIKTQDFTLRAFERASNQGSDVTIYIEGEGDDWSAHRTEAQNPTPRDPIALHLAARDQSANVVYLARPCQYITLDAGGSCHTSKYWNEGRYAPEVVASINEAIDNIKSRYSFKDINLVGYEGGGAIAVLVAARRYDVASIRTVATALDHKKRTELYNRIELTDSLNPIDVAQEVARIPQHHFLPKWDRFGTDELYKDFYHASGDSGCLRASVIKDTDVDEGWAKRWPSLLAEPLDCLNL